MAIDRDGLVAAGHEHVVERAHGDGEEVLIEHVREGLELGPENPIVEGWRRRDDDGGALMADGPMGIKAVAAAERDEDRATTGVQDRDGEGLIALPGARLGQARAETIDASANRGGVGAPGEREEAGLDGAHAIERKRLAETISRWMWLIRMV